MVKKFKDTNVNSMETFKNNLRTITQYLSNLRIVLKIQGRLVTLVVADFFYRITFH